MTKEELIKKEGLNGDEIKTVKDGLNENEFNNIANGTSEGVNNTYYFNIHGSTKITKQILISQIEYLFDIDWCNTKEEINFLNSVLKRIKGDI